MYVRANDDELERQLNESGGTPQETLEKVGSFEAEAHDAKIDDQDVVALWGDGIMTTADNVEPCEIKLEKGKRYRVTIEEIKD